MKHLLVRSEIGCCLTMPMTVHQSSGCSFFMSHPRTYRRAATNTVLTAVTTQQVITIQGPLFCAAHALDSAFWSDMSADVYARPVQRENDRWGGPRSDCSYSLRVGPFLFRCCYTRYSWSTERVYEYINSNGSRLIFLFYDSSDPRI